MHETILTNNHGIAHWSVIKHAEQYKDLIIQTRPKKQSNNQIFMEIYMAY